MLEDHKTEVDAIFLFAGTNDFNGNTPLGDWFIEGEKSVLKDLNSKEKQKRRFREFNFNTDSFKGSINSVLAFLKEAYYDKQIVLLTPIHRAYATFGEQNVQYDEMYSNAIGNFFDEYVATVKEAANIWSCELIDLNSASGLFPLYDKSADKYFCNIATDRLHPNVAGHKRLADTILSKLGNIRI
jgi:lysophospholipase L1-like esterase